MTSEQPYIVEKVTPQGTREIIFVDTDTGDVLRPTLPPPIPLTEKDLTDPLLQPVTITPSEVYQDDEWEIITDSGETRSAKVLLDLIEWLLRHRTEYRRFTILRHEEGDPK